MSNKIDKDKSLLNEKSNNPDLILTLDNIIDAKELAEIEAIQSAIEENDTPIEDIETAAGEASDGGRSVVVDVSRDAKETLATSYFKTEALFHIVLGFSNRNRI